MKIVQIVLHILALAILTCCSDAAASEERDVNEEIHLVESIKDKLNTNLEIMLPESMPQELDSDKVKEDMHLAFSSYYQYRIQSFEHRMDAFRWQAFASKIIFVVVIILVGIGIYFSWIQFHRSVSGAGNFDTEGDGSNNTNLDLGPFGIRVNSSVLGIIILALSLSFFYLYLLFVYPISDTF